MKLIATKSLRYAGRSLKAGDHFEAKDRDAKLLKAIKKATDAPRNKVGRPKKEESESVKAELPNVSPTDGAEKLAGGTYSTRVTSGE